MDNSLFALYDEIAQHPQLEVVGVKMKSRTALVRPDGLIAIDYSKIKSAAEEKAVLMEEIEHFEVYAFYPADAPHHVWEKQEARAQRHIFEKRFPPQDIAALMARGYTEAYELAEQLDLPERFVEQILLYYTEVRGIDFARLIDDLGAIPPARKDPWAQVRPAAQLLPEAVQAPGAEQVEVNGLVYDLPAGMTAAQVQEMYEAWAERADDEAARHRDMRAYAAHVQAVQGLSLREEYEQEKKYLRAQRRRELALDIY